MQYIVNVITKIEAQSEECVDKNVYVYTKDNPEGQKKFNKLVRETLVNLACDYLEDEIYEPEDVSNETIIQELTDKLHCVDLYEGDYFNFTHEDGTREIEIDIETYIAK